MDMGGIDTFKEFFKGFEDNYVIIGGTACEIHEDLYAQVYFTDEAVFAHIEGFTGAKEEQAKITARLYFNTFVTALNEAVREGIIAENPWKGYNVPEYSCGSIKAADGETDLYWR